MIGKGRLRIPKRNVAQSLIIIPWADTKSCIEFKLNFSVVWGDRFSSRHHMGRANGIKQLQTSFRKFSLSLSLLILVYIYWMHYDVRPTEHAREPAQYTDFINTWCRQRRARMDWEGALRPCAEKMEWSKELDVSNWTDVSKTYLTLWDIRAAGEFSRFGLQTLKSNNDEKRVGGDSWRVHIRGPSSVSPTVIDHNNGTYEMIFLVLEPGKYKVEVILEFSMCDGYKDPPLDWFMRGMDFEPKLDSQ